ncbi:MAG: hypothetical protein NT126_08070 [Bacteroidetes bacterium]|nr:hypothetical protein [Bacteroidota bacterium]
MADSLNSLAKIMLHGENDSVRISANASFKNKISDVLGQPDVIEFDSVKNISSLTAPDNSFRILTWTLPSYDGSYTFFGFIQTTDKKTKQHHVIELTDSTLTIDKPESSKLKAGRWYGAVYYKILLNKKEGKNFYTLLGWKGKNQMATQKVVDVLYFPGDVPLFGYPFFKTENVYRNRLIFEYTSQAVMSLHYEDKKKLIVFDHLSSSGKGETNHPLQGPGGSFDALQFKNGKWILLKDIDTRNYREPKEQPKEPQIHEAPVKLIK